MGLDGRRAGVPLRSTVYFKAPGASRQRNDDGLRPSQLYTIQQRSFELALPDEANQRRAAPPLSSSTRKHDEAFGQLLIAKSGATPRVYAVVTQ